MLLYMREKLAITTLVIMLALFALIYRLWYIQHYNAESYNQKVLSQQMNADNRVKAQKVLELNTEHPVFAKLQALYTDDPTKIFDYAELLYDQALLIEGLPVEDPVRFSNLICDLM